MSPRTLSIYPLSAFSFLPHLFFFQNIFLRLQNPKVDFTLAFYGNCFYLCFHPLALVSSPSSEDTAYQFYLITKHFYLFYLITNTACQFHLITKHCLPVSIEHKTTLFVFIWSETLLVSFTWSENTSRCFSCRQNISGQFIYSQNTSNQF